MGTGASKSGTTATVVTPITSRSLESVESEAPVTHRPPSGVSRRWSLRRRNSIKDQGDNEVIAALQKRLDEYIQEIDRQKEEKATAFQSMRELEKQLADAESSNLDLEERIQVLTEHLEQQQQPLTPTGEEDGSEFTHTLTIKDKQIAKLEAELSDAQSNIVKLRARFKKKVKSLKNVMSELQHESSLELLDSKTTAQHLKEENKKLAEKLKHAMSQHPTAGGGGGGAASAGLFSPREQEVAEAGKTQVILELSAKVSEQEARIMELEKELIATECGVVSGGEHRAVPKSPRPVHRSHSNVTYASSENQRRMYKMKEHAKSVDYVSMEDRHKHLHHRAMSPLPQDSLEDDSLGSTKALAGEIERMRQQKSKKKRLARHYSREDQRESSGVSRDSGVMSTENEVSPQHRTGHRSGAAGVASAGPSAAGASYRPTSATSTLSNMSDIDSYSLSEENSLSGGKTYVISKDDLLDEELTPKAKPANIRQISAPKKKKKREVVSDYEHVRELLRTPADNEDKPL